MPLINCSAHLMYLPSYNIQKKSFARRVRSPYLLLSSLALNSWIFIAWTTFVSRLPQISRLLYGKLYFLYPYKWFFSTIFMTYCLESHTKISISTFFHFLQNCVCTVKELDLPFSLLYSRVWRFSHDGFSSYSSLSQSWTHQCCCFLYSFHVQGIKGSLSVEVLLNINLIFDTVLLPGRINLAYLYE